MQDEKLQFDVLIIGAGPAGLATAIQLIKNNPSLEICVIEKATHIGGHSLSGAVFEKQALSELIPNWQTLNPSLSVPVKDEKFFYMTKSHTYRLPLLASMKNTGNVIISLSELCHWLAEQATKLGVNVFSGFSGQQLILSENRVIGVKSHECELLAKQTVFAEGTRGSLTQQVIKHFKLDKNSAPQTYAIGLKELWRITPEKHALGRVIHTVGWPLNHSTYGGGFIYHFKENLVSLGIIIGLDYKNPYLDPFQELQRFKQHPAIKSLLRGGKCVCFGARALNEGGWQSLPKLTFPGGLLVGCAAGMVDVAKIKGIHNAIRSGILAAKAIIENVESSIEIKNYQTRFNRSVIAKELKMSRNLRPAFRKGLWSGLSYAAIDQLVFRGKAPWTFQHKHDHLALKPKENCQPIIYPKPDGKITFDKMSQIFLSNTHTNENQTCHLRIKDPEKAVSNHYAAPETRYCPAAVYEIVSGKLQINASNCIHCKLCDIKDPFQNIEWQTPEGGSGPNYTLM